MRAPWRAVRTVAEALKPAAGGADAAARRRTVDDWTRPLAFANEHFLTAALYAGLSAADRLADLPTDVCTYLRFIHDLNRERNEALRRQAVELIGALNNAGVVPTLLKGALALFGDLYPDPAARMIRDIDVLVAADEVELAARTLQQLGYDTIARYEAGHNAYGDFARPHDPGAIDLHTDLVEMPYLLPAAEVWKRSRRVDAAPGAAFLAPAPTDMALHHLLHAQIHYLGNFYRGVVELRQVYEFATLVDRRADIDWPAVEERLGRHRLGTALESYALTAQRLFGCRWPLPHPPSRRAASHSRRCLLQLCWPALVTLGTPLANIRAAFAWHRMNYLYGQDRGRGSRRLRHAWQFIHKKPAGHVIGRVFRA